LRDDLFDGDQPVVRFDHVGVRYGTSPEVLSDVAFTLEPGTFYFLTGDSGAGKSTLMRLMYLSLRPTRGLVHLFGRDVSTLPREAMPELRRKIGVVFQDFQLLDHLSAIDNVAVPLRVAGARGSDVRKHVSELLRWVGLGDRLTAKPATLSGGEQQRVAIARAVINQPALLLADEPTGNVDDNMGVRLIQLFEELNRMGTTVIIATHNSGLVDQFRYPRLELEDGALQIVGG